MIEERKMDLNLVANSVREKIKRVSIADEKNTVYDGF